MNLKPNQLFKLALCVLIVFPMVFWLPYGTHRAVKIIEMLAFLYLAMEVYKRSVGFSYFWIGSAIIVNPFIPLIISIFLWPVNAIWMLALMVMVVFDI
jgi:hypothetical protein